MNIRNILTGTIAIASFVSTVQAQTEIRVTGATAFRAAATSAIRAQFALGGNYQYAHNQTAGGAIGADRITFRGSFPGISGTTTVRVSWNGSVEGIRAVAIGGSFNPAFITDAGITVAAAPAGGESFGVTGSTAIQVAKFSFSDVLQTSTPVASPTLNPSDAAVGITTFALLANEGAPANLTNVTFQQFQSLFSLGKLPLSAFTGNPLDTKTVYASGRNDGSGTRTTYMAESKLGITTPVKQYVATTASGNDISVLRLAPSTATLGAGTFASTLWNQDIDGNGGYVSGSSLRTDFGRLSGNVTVLNADGIEVLDGPAANVQLITFLSTPDARTAASNGGKILGWNGYGLTSLQTSSTLSIADRDAIAEGRYTAWSFQQLYYNGSLSAAETTFDTALRAGIQTDLLPTRLNGLPLLEMHVGRPDDGAPVAP